MTTRYYIIAKVIRVRKLSSLQAGLCVSVMLFIVRIQSLCVSSTISFMYIFVDHPYYKSYATIKVFNYVL